MGAPTAERLPAMLRRAGDSLTQKPEHGLRTAGRLPESVLTTRRLT